MRAATRGPACGAAAAEPIIVGTRRQLLFDDRFVGEADCFGHVLERPSLPPENLLPAINPWESSRAGAYISVIQRDGCFRLYYEAIADGIRSLSNGSRWTP